MSDNRNGMTGEELIDSVKEVDLKIRDHRADEDFEKMLAQLNGKKAEREKEKSAPPKKANETPVPAEKAEEKKDQKKSPEAVPAMAAVAQGAGALKRPAPQTAKRQPKNPPAKKRRPAPKPSHKPADEEKPLIKNLNEVWKNPNLASGGRVSMNIKTELRKEITITVPNERLVKKPAKEPAPAPLRQSGAKPAAKKKIKSDGKNPAAVKAEKMTKAEMTAKQFQIINVAVCALMFFGIGFFLLACDRESGFIQSENRNLAEKPKLTVQSLIDGSYFEDLGVWYTDTVPGREELKPFSNSFTKLFGIAMNDVKIKGGVAPAVKEELDPNDVKQTQVTINTDFKNTTASSRAKKTGTEKLAEVPEELDDGEWMGNVVVSGKGENVRAMSAFYGTFDMGKKYAETISRYREDLGSAVNIYTMNMPTSAAYYMPENLADQFTSQHDCIKNIGNNLGGIVNVDVYDALDEHKDEYIYSRTDHHWAPLGAYYAAQVFAETARVDFPDLGEYEECRIENFVGTMYAYSDYDEELKENPDTFIYYKPDNDYTVNYYDSYFSNPQYGGSLFYDYAEGVNCYSAILGSDDLIAEIETDCDNGRTLVIFKDSFGNALVPFLTHGFSKIYVCDFRYFDINAIDFCFDVGATDVLFAVSLSAAHTESHINAIGNDRIQTAETQAPEETAALPEEYIPEGEAETSGVQQ